MKYKIKVNYDTGDSFHNETGVEDYLEWEHENLDVAKENLRRIKAHYDMYKRLNERWGARENRETILQSCKNEPWFVEKDTQRYLDPEYQLRLKVDNGNDLQLSAFWCGYFEHLNYAEIVPSENDLIVYA